jgi:hypothetical protein
MTDYPQEESTMKPSALPILGISLVAVAAVAAIAQPTARPQVQATPSYIPIGVAASGSASTAWFHNPASGTVLACQSSASGAALSNIQCVTTKLP